MTSPMRVLMIEDCDSDAELVAIALRQAGRLVEYERVQDASSMRAALEKGGWDLLISDWSMPRFSALGALDVVKAMGLDIPFIILSGTIGEETAVEGMRAGAHDFLLKDRLARLGPAVEREIRASKGRHAHRQGEQAARAREARFRAIIEDSGQASLAGRLRRTFILLSVVVGIGFVVTALSLALTWTWIFPEFDECRRARDAASDLEAAMLDEQTGLREYFIQGDAHLLGTYHRGTLAFARTNEALDAQAALRSAFTVPLVRTRAAAERWHEWAKLAVEMPVDASARSAQEGKELFDAYRAEQTAFESAIARRTEILTRREQQAIGVPAALELVIFMSLLLGAWRKHHALREAITAPVAALLRDIGRVRDGELITTIDQSGPSELRQLGAGLNDMVHALATARGVADSRDELAREHADRLRQILDASREFYESLNLKYVVGSVRSHTMAVGGYDQVNVWLISDDKKGLLDAGAEPSMVTLEQSVDHALAWRAATSGRITFEEADGRVRFGDPGARPVRARAIPLVVGARVVGALEARHVDARAASREAVEVLEMLAAHAATAIESARLNQVSEERSQMDPLTQLHNRRRLDEDLDAECKRCVRYGRPLAFVMLDVDHFKAFNDAHGHPQADVVLQEVAAVISSSVRVTDSAYRYGGEEFCVVLRETDGPAAMQFAERLRQCVELRFANGTMPNVTASFGVAEFSPDIQTPRALVEAADAAMYESKRAGRNRVMLSSKPPQIGSDFFDSSGTIRVSKITA